MNWVVAQTFDEGPEALLEAVRICFDAGIDVNAANTKGIRAIQEAVGVKAVYDLSATPFYLGGSGYKEGYIFPWTVSDFSLMDAIESGIVKAPRIPVDDDTTVDTVTYRNLWELVGKDLWFSTSVLRAGTGDVRSLRVYR